MNIPSQISCFQDHQRSAATTTQIALNQPQKIINHQYRGKYHHWHYHSLPGEQLFCQCHLHQWDSTLEKHSFQDHHHAATANSTRNNAFQDHIFQHTTNNAQVHHIITRDQSSQDHCYTPGDTTHCRYLHISQTLYQHHLTRSPTYWHTKQTFYTKTNVKQTMKHEDTDENENNNCLEL